MLEQLCMRLKPFFMAFLLSTGLLPVGNAAEITNKIIGVGPSDQPINPYVCIQDGNGKVTYALKPGVQRQSILCGCDSAFWWL
jgi:hypothetical protein